MSATQPAYAVGFTSDTFGAYEINRPIAGVAKFRAAMRLVPMATQESVEVVPHDAHRSEALRAVRVISGTQWLAGRAISRPILVQVTGTSGGGMCVSHEHTGIFGVGETLPAAIEDFRDALLEHRDVLQESQPLSSDLEEQLSFLRQHLSA